MPHYHDGNVEEMEDDYDMDEPVEDMDEVENHGPVAIGSDSDEDEDDEYGRAVASVTFDLLFLLVLGSYLIVLFSFLVITTRGLDDLINIFRRPPSRKVKGA